MYATLLFPNYETAIAAAQSLGFWNDPEPIYEMVPDPEGETTYHYRYRDLETGSENLYTYELTPEQLVEEGLELIETIELPALIQEQVGMTEGSVKTSGQTVREDGSAFSWSIDQIGTDPIVVSGTYDDEGNELTPPKRLKGYAVNVCGEIPSEALVFEILYGSAGRIYAGMNPVEVEYLDLEGEPGYVIPAAI